MATFGSLFAGIGGIDLGLERAGWAGRWQVEWDPFCQRVLEHHWPGLPRYGDITTVDWSQVEPVDLIAGGFPCQPFSNAGKRLGKADDRWLWPEFARAIGALRPRLVLVENVPGLLAGHGGMGAVVGDLASLGYDAEWDLIPASAVGAPHLRYRVWIVAYADGSSIERGRISSRVHAQHADPDGRGPQADVADPTGGRQPGPWQPFDAFHPETSAHWQATEPLDGRSSHQWSVEPDVGRVAHGVPARVDRLRSIGNAVVPQVVEVIGRQLMAALR